MSLIVCVLVVFVLCFSLLEKQRFPTVTHILDKPRCLFCKVGIPPVVSIFLQLKSYKKNE